MYLRSSLKASQHTDTRSPFSFAQPRTNAERPWLSKTFSPASSAYFTNIEVSLPSAQLITCSRATRSLRFHSGSSNSEPPPSSAIPQDTIGVVPIDGVDAILSVT
eukprot:9500718-Pyramimonas_sp.AAC.1